MVAIRVRLFHFGRIIGRGETKVIICLSKFGMLSGGIYS